MKRSPVLLGLVVILTAGSTQANSFFGQMQRVLCNDGYDRFETKFDTGVTVLVGAAKRGELAKRSCSAALKWNYGELSVVPEASQVDIDVLGADLGLDKPVVAFQVKKSAGDVLMTYRIYSLEKPPRLLRSITGGGYFNAADVDLEGRAAIWTSDAAAIDGFDGLAFGDFDFPPTVVLRFERGHLIDVSSEFRSQID